MSSKGGGILPPLALYRFSRPLQLYARPNRSVSEHDTLAEVARRHPQAIVCLLSARRVRDITMQSPFEVWLAIPNKARAPKMDYPPLRIVRFSGAALTDGIEEHQIDGVTVRVTNVARTVADCNGQDKPDTFSGSLPIKSSLKLQRRLVA